MGNPNRRRLCVELPRDELERFKYICSVHNVYPGTVLRSVIEKVIAGELVISPDIRKIPLAAVAGPIKLVKRKRKKREAIKKKS